MANAKSPRDARIPDWWGRQKERQNRLLLVFLVALLILIGFYYWVSHLGSVQLKPGISFNTHDVIAFVRQDEKGNTDLYAIHADGTGLRKLTAEDDKSNKREPCWTTDGAHLVYSSNYKDPRTWQIYVLGDGDPTQLTVGMGNKSVPVASPDGQRIGFISQGAIKTILLNGNDIDQVMPPPQAGNSDSEGATPNGSLDASASIRGAFHDVDFSGDGHGIAGVKELGGDDTQVNLQDIPLGDQAAFALPEGASRSTLLNSGRKVSVAWAPSGNELACAFSELNVTGPDKKSVLISGIDLWTFAGEKGTPKHMFMTRGYTLAPRNVVWSPDGSKIAFEGWRIKNENEQELRGIIVVPVLRDKSIQIATPAEAEADHYLVPVTADGKPQRPIWSPDSKRLLYEVVGKNGKRDLWTINVDDGTNRVNLTNGQGDNSQAAWSPAPLK